MSDKIAVIKLGGHAMDDADLLAAFAADLVQLSKKGMKFVIVHGGGPAINALLKRLNIQSNFVNGLRVTTEQTLAAVEMALCGEVNKAVVRHLQKYGLAAAGISGQDGMLLQAAIKDPILGLVGEIRQVNTPILTALLTSGFLPVIAPVALSKDFQPLNVNADTAAGAMAGALNADYFILISDVPGVLDANKKLLPRLALKEIADLRKSEVITGGMIPKVECCHFALQHGSRTALILDGRQPNALARFIDNNERLGTVITL